MILKYYNYFKEAKQQDIFDFTYEYSSDRLNNLSNTASSLPRKGVFIRIISFLLHLFMNISTCYQGRGEKKSPGRIVFFICSKNEYDSLQPVYQQISGSKMVGLKYADCCSFPYFWAYLMGLIFFPLVLINYIKAKGYKRKSFLYIFDQYMLSYGMNIVGRIWLNRLKPMALVVSNHLAPKTRVMIKIAQDEAILTFYIQHASVNEGYPPLNFDFALLEGMDSLEKYLYSGVTTSKVFLVGTPKHDQHFHNINTRKKVYSIGICTNILDSLSRAEQLCCAIRHAFPNLPIYIRPHIADRRIKKRKCMASEFDLDFSDMNTELSYDFLTKVDAIIAGDSTILLEATLMNVFALYYDFTLVDLDYYGFVRDGLVEYSSEPEEIYKHIQKLIANKPAIRMKAKRYCATVGTQYDGHSSELTSLLIQKLIFGNQISLDEWTRLPDIAMAAYELHYDSV